MRTLLLATCLLLVSSSFAQTEVPVIPDKPGGTFSAHTLNKKQLQFEPGLIYLGSKPSDTTLHTILLKDVSWRMAITNRIELNTGFRFGAHFLNYRDSLDFHAFGLYDWRAGARFKILNGKGWKPTLSLYGGVMATFPPSLIAMPEIRIITLNSWNKFFFATNIGYVPILYSLGIFQMPFGVKLGTGSAKNCGLIVDISGNLLNPDLIRYGVGVWLRPTPKIRLDFFGSFQAYTAKAWLVQSSLTWRIDWSKTP